MVDIRHLLTKREAANLLGTCERTIKRMWNRGEIKAVVVVGGEAHKPGRRFLRFDRDALLIWKRSHEKKDGHPCAEEQPPETME